MITRHFDRRSRGQALVELAIILPVFMVLVLAALDFGRLFFARISVENAAREGAYDASYGGTYAANTACGSSNSVMCAVLNEAQGSLTIAPADVVLSCSRSGGCAAGDYPDQVTVQVTGHFNLLTPILSVFFGGTNLAFSSTASADMVDTETAAAGLPTFAPSAAATVTPTAAPTAAPTSGPVPTVSPGPTAGPTAPTCSLPFANFTHSQARKQDPVNFTSTSTPVTGDCAITFWRWDFGDGTTDAKTVPTTSHDYGNQARGRTFNVTLTVTNPAGSISVIKAVTTLN